MNTFRRDIQIGMLSMVGVVLFAGAALCPASAQTRYESVYNGHRIIYPESSIARPGRHHTNYFFVDSDKLAPQPPPGVETPGSVACVYKLVAGPTGCPVATSTTVPNGGIGAIAIVDAGYYPTAQSDLDAFDSYYGIPAVTLTQTWPAVNPRPPVYPDWEVEEALDIEWAHAMAPHAKLFLVVSALCTSPQCATDPSWAAVQLAGNLVAQNGGGVVSMSFADAEIPGEINLDTNFAHAGVVYFAAAGDGGLGVSAYPAASPNVVAVGGTYFNRDGNGNFTYEQYYTGGGGGDISPYEPRPSYQNGIASIVGNHRGYPDVASDFCCAPIYLEGGWGSVGGTSWSSPTFAGIVNAAGTLQQSSRAELTMMYNELANPAEYSADFNDITLGDPRCKVGWDLCTGIGSAKTYAGK
jgi:kumamolisin